MGSPAVPPTEPGAERGAAQDGGAAEIEPKRSVNMFGLEFSPLYKRCADTLIRQISDNCQVDEYQPHQPEVAAIKQPGEQREYRDREHLPANHHDTLPFQPADDLGSKTHL